MVLLLIAAKADVNKENNDGMTPLNWAAHKGHDAVVELLIAAKAEGDTVDKATRKRALMVAGRRQ
jgi:ankyrin repeat protein